MISDLDTLFESGGNVSFPPIVEAIAPDGKDPSVDLARGEFSEVQNDLAPLFVQSLVANMRDGVVSIDDQYTIRIWNRGAERLTGKAGQGIVNQTWNPGLIGLCDASRMPISNEHCPVRHAIGKSVQSIRRLWINKPAGDTVSIDLHIVPVVDSFGNTVGANLLLRDISSETSLERQVQTLYERATTDQLTQICNRAQFDRAHKNFIEMHLLRDAACSLIICDIDQFKKVNDTFGHLAGDDALRLFAKLLSENCRRTDLVARYGGEEFVILCSECSLSVAATRAESIRHQLEQLRLPMLRGKQLTASFGVAEHHSNETTGAMLHRADKALLSAKESGRNRVVQMGPG